MKLNADNAATLIGFIPLIFMFVRSLKDPTSADMEEAVTSAAILALSYFVGKPSYLSQRLKRIVQDDLPMNQIDENNLES
jgi:hypothetical protein